MPFFSRSNPFIFKTNLQPPVNTVSPYLAVKATSHLTFSGNAEFLDPAGSTQTLGFIVEQPENGTTTVLVFAAKVSERVCPEDELKIPRSFCVTFFEEQSALTID
ncbi:MAG: hypothetical protein M1834_000264 [Cirrosporium novae-zelandiae]|nr:MAG: hypothetical protein M1834_000264 [Cirrosporium novae-zelandiae]